MRHVPVFLSLALFFVLGACKPEPYLNVSPASLSFSEDGGTQTVRVSANYPWTVNVSGKGFSVSPASGDGDASVTVTASPTNEPDPVTVNLVFLSEGLSSNVELRQAARNTIMVGNVAKIPAEGGTFEVPVQYNTEFSVEVDPDAKSWISFVETKALTSGKLVFDVEENTLTDPRAGKVTVKDRSGKVDPVIITLVQEEKKVIEVGDVTKIATEGGTYEITIEYNTDFSVEVEESAQAWIQFVETKAMTSGRMVFFFKANETADARSGKVTIRDKSGKVKPIILTFVQEEKKVIEVGDVTEIPAEGGTYEVEIAYNTEFSVEVETSAQPWISFVETKALTSGKMVFVFAENTATDSRSGKVVVRDKSGKADPVTMTFVQQGVEPYFRLICDEAESLPYEAGELKVFIEHNVAFKSYQYSVMNVGTDDLFIFDSMRFSEESALRSIMTISYGQNNTRHVRAGRIIFWDDSMQYSDTLFVYQQPLRIITSDLEAVVPAVASEFSFRVAEDKTDNYRVEYDADWIELVQSQGKEGGAEYRWKTKDNPGMVMREAQIKVYLNGFEEPDVFRVYQEGSGLSISVTYSGKQVKAPSIYGLFPEKSTIWWGDGDSMPYSGGASHTYKSSGSHTVKVVTTLMEYIERAEVTELEEGMHIDFSKMRSHDE